MSKKRLFIVDAMALAFRSFHAIQRPLATASGMPTQAVYGSLMFLLNLIESEKPDYLLIATDTSAKTFRHDLYPDYKANRSDMPEDLAIQIPYLYRMFECLGCQVLRVDGLEADDLIGAVVTQWASPDLHCYIVSGDKDFLQLINDNISLYSPKKGGEVKITDIDGVFEKFGVSPHQVIDALALIGDSADNVPGVPGIGEKGAAKLIQAYGSLEGIYEHIDSISNKRSQNALSANREKAFLSRELVTIKTDIDLAVDVAATSCDVPSALANDDLLTLIKELEFRSLERRIQKKMDAASETPSSDDGADKPKSQDTSRQDYQLSANRADLEACLSLLANQTSFSFDTETTGLDVISDKPIGISFSCQPHQAFYIPLRDEHLEGIDAESVQALVADLLQNSEALKIAHNLKFDLQMLSNLGIRVKGPFADSMIASYLLDSAERSHGLDACCLRYLNYRKIKTENLLGESGSMLDSNLEELSQYACEDADLCLQLYRALEPMLQASELLNVFENVEMPLVPLLARIERSGIFVDTEVLEKLSWELEQKAKELESKIFELAGEEFNIRSPKQLQVILYDKLKIHEELGIKRLKKTKSGFSTDVSVLEQMRAHPLVEALLEYRQVTKLKSTYVDTLPQLIHAQSGRLHTSFHQTGTATGRLSSSDPNLQNIPIRSRLGREIRKAFRAETPDHCIISADYSQVELRILASLSKDEHLRQAFIDDLDIHTATAARIFGVSENQINPDQRAQAKAINFGIIYGMGPQRLARETGVSNKEAKAFIERYFASYPKIKTYIEEAIRFAKEHGYTKTLTGRRRPLPEIHSQDRMTLANAQNIAVNSPVQGSAADLIKLAMIEIQKKLDDSSLDARMLLQVHDELVFECLEAEQDAVQEIIRACMENALDIGVPLKVEVGIGSNWLEAH